MRNIFLKKILMQNIGKKLPRPFYGVMQFLLYAKFRAIGIYSN